MGKDLASKKGNRTEPEDRLGTARKGERVGTEDFFGEGITAPFALCC